MMKRNIFAGFAAFALFSLFAVSCQPKEDDQPEAATLTLSAQTLMMDNQAQTPSTPQITFQTNQSKVVVTAQADWLDAMVQGNGILIKAMANDQGKDRKADVLVFAGSVMDKITVTQSTADIVLEVSPNSRTVSNMGEEFFISVKSNSDSWVIEPSEFDWIKVEKFTSELIRVTVEPNKEENAREGQLYTKLGTAAKQINIVQVGVGNERFMIPLLKKNPTQFEILDYEANLGNKFLTYSPAFPSWGVMDESYTFVCASPVFEQVIYNFDISKQAISYVGMLSKDPESLKSTEFKDFLTEKGFEIGTITEDGSFTAVNEDANFKLTVAIVVDGTAYSTLQFIPIVKQIDKYPTFAKFPYDKSNLLNNAEWPSAKVIEMELAAKSIVTKTFSDKYPELLTLIMAEQAESTDREVPVLRVYFFGVDEEAGTTTDLVEEFSAFWKDYTLGAWMDGNTFILTNEFKEILDKEGFEFFREVKGNSYYYHKEKQLMIVPRGAQFSDVLEGAPVFVISYFNYVVADSSLNDPILKNLEFNKIVKKLEVQDARLNSRK